MKEVSRLVFRLFVSALGDLFRSRASLEAEIVALRHEVAVLKQRLGRRRVRLTWRDRMLWVGLSRVWPDWRSSLVIVRPETMLRWHRESFRAYWRWKARPRGGRPRVDRETRELIARLHRENPLWGAPRIHGELLMLGLDVCESTVSNYLHELPRLPSQNWRTFVRNHIRQSVAVDLAVVPTIKFSLLYVFVVLDHERRRIFHINVTATPTAQWAAQQVVEALPWETNVRVPVLRRRRDLWRGIRAAGQGPRPAAGRECASLAMAKRLLRAGDRYASTRVPRSYGCCQRAPVEARPR